MGKGQEFEVVKAIVPKGFVCLGNYLVIGNSDGGDKIHGAVRGSDGNPWLLISRAEQLRPEWTPPGLKNGWLTWDDTGGWWWWSDRPKHTDEYGWVNEKTGRGDGGEEIGPIVAQFFGFPCCDGFDERHCIWEVGE